jgi:hypothetical protein
MSETRSLNLIKVGQATPITLHGTSIGYSVSGPPVPTDGLGGTSFLSGVIDGNTTYTFVYNVGGSAAISGIPLKSDDTNVPTVVVTIIQF